MKMAKSLRLLCVIGLISTFWVGILRAATAEKKPVQTVVVSDCSVVGDLQNDDFVKAGSVSLCDKDSTKIPESSLLCIAVRNLTSSLCKLPPKESAIRASISDEDVTATCQKMVPVIPKVIQTAPKEILVNVVNVTVTTQLSSKDTCEKLCEKSSLLCSFVYEGISRLVVKTKGSTNTKPDTDKTQSVDHVDDPSTETKGQNNPTENKETLKTGEQKVPQKPAKTEKPQTPDENKEPQTPDENKEPQQPENEEHNEPQTLDENKELQKPDNEEHKEPLKPDNEEHKEPQTLDENKEPLKPDNGEHKEPLKPDNEEHKEPQTLDENKGPLKPDNEHKEPQTLDENKELQKPDENKGLQKPENGEHKEPQTLDENKELQKPDENKGLQKPENEEHKEPQTPDENKGPQKPEDIKNKEAKKPKVDEEDLEEQYIDHSIKNSGDISPDYNKDENDQGESVGLQEISDTSDGNPDDEDVNEEVAPVPPEEDFGDIAVGGVKTHYAVGVDPDDGNSHFFVYFITIVGMSAILYIVFHNKKKILALILEGRNNRGRRPNSAQYRKLDNNLDEVIAGSTKKLEPNE